MEREELRAKTTDLIQRLRGEQVPHALWELLDVFAARLDRLELGTFETQEETPTKPERRVSSATVAAVKPIDVKVSEIFEQAKKQKKPKKGGGDDDDDEDDEEEDGE